jgi:hypothetical protein
MSRIDRRKNRCAAEREIPEHEDRKDRHVHIIGIRSERGDESVMLRGQETMRATRGLRRSGASCCEGDQSGVAGRDRRGLLRGSLRLPRMKTGDKLDRYRAHLA